VSEIVNNRNLRDFTSLLSPTARHRFGEDMSDNFIVWCAPMLMCLRNEDCETCITWMADEIGATRLYSTHEHTDATYYSVI